MAEFIKFVDVSKCDGCRACMTACKEWNDLPNEPEEFHGSYQSHESLTAHTWNVLTFNEHENSNGNFEWLFKHTACLHCTDAACEKACPEDAISHTEFGTVEINYDKCVGCGYCVTNCPFDAVHLATYLDDKGKEYRVAKKCTQCVDRLEQGMKPACVTACATESLVYDEKDKIFAKAEERLAVIKERFPNANIYYPEGIRGGNTVYLLTEKPSVYGLPENPKVPLSQVVWKDYAQPVGKALFGVTTMAVIGGVIANVMNRGKDGHEGGKDHE